ncbi:MAG: 2-amino-4-hydroxy-6-hydroxymethyldihydropteridine diphosphokinase [Pseudomonadota bacterium]|nr:2-amino-4-hydroxy-6-hydroxymethyldihydropteridine diphosphokinase [Pseudomonadota bacterium]
MIRPAIAYVGLGGNVGDASASVRAALDALDDLPDTQLLRASRLYRTPAWGLHDQPDFINAVAALETGLSARDLLDAMLGVERAFGRDRETEPVRWGPRTLDLDLLLHGDAVIDAPGLRVPHPHLHQRAFVLVPLLEIAPDLRIPGRGSARDALSAMATDGIEALL